MSKLRQHILDEIDDCVDRFLYYDRKEDEDLPRGSIEKAVADGTITVEEICEAFEEALKASLK